MRSLDNSESNMQKVALTALAGTSIEWYDFFLYGAAAALIFPTAFFGEATPSTALILSLLTFAAGFIARPIGGIIFGHYGDRIGRKKTLVIALILMGVSSTLIGLLPTYAMIGVTAPILEAIRKYPNRIALAAGAFLSIQVTFYILIAFLLAYGVSSAEISRDAMLAAVLIASAIMVPSQFMFSSISDRYGRRGIFMAGAILTGLWAYAIFPLVDTGNFYLIVLAITFGLIFVGMMYGPQAAFFTELFTTEVRYSGATLGYQFGAILGGAFAPTIAAFLWNNFGIFWVSVYISFASLLTLLSVMALTETYKTNLNDS